MSRALVARIWVVCASLAITASMPGTAGAAPVAVPPAVQPAVPAPAALAAARIGAAPRLDTTTRARLASVLPVAAAGLIPAGGTAPGRPLTIGVALPVPDLERPAAMDAMLSRIEDAAGQPLLGLRVRSPGARGLRLGLLVEALPPGAELAFYAAGREIPVAAPVTGAEVTALIAANLAAGDASDEGRTYWGPVVDGEEATLLVRLPPGGDPAEVRIALPRVSHLFADPFTALAAASCNLDLSCQSAAWQGLGNAVAKMVYTSFGNTFLCTGSLLNDIDPATFIPYFISANHCISTQTAASTLQTHWFYQSAACGSSDPDPRYTVLTGGADLLYSDDDTDTSFMRLRATPPAGVTFLGWTNAKLPGGSDVAGLHHPTGDLKKISFGEAIDFFQCTGLSAEGTFTCTPSPVGKYIRVDWSAGTVEGGSSGSGLILEPGYLVGTLYGGNSVCAGTAGDSFYGRFDIPFDAVLHEWLAQETYNKVVYRHSGKCQDVFGASGAAGAQVIQWPCHGQGNQRLALRPAEDGYFSLAYQHSGQCTDVFGAGTAAATRVIQWPCHGGDNQLFTLEDQGDGHYAFRFKHSGQCVDVFGAGSEDAANVIQWPCHGGDNQLFRFEP